MTNTESSSSGEPRWQALRSVAIPCFEWTGFVYRLAALGEHCERPGQVNRLTGLGRSLHYASDRWLIPHPAPSTLEELERAANAGDGVLTEISGKWLLIRLVGAAIAGAARHEPSASPLAAGFAQEHVLKDRDCAALWLFDCPVIVSRDARGLEIWLEASYEASFLSTLESLGVIPSPT